MNQLKPFIDLNLVLERMAAFSLPEVEGLERDVKGLPTDLLIDICRGFMAALDYPRTTEVPDAPVSIRSAAQCPRPCHGDASCGASASDDV